MFQIVNDVNVVYVLPNNEDVITDVIDIRVDLTQTGTTVNSIQNVTVVACYKPGRCFFV